jgi:hypothetical protein
MRGAIFTEFVPRLEDGPWIVQSGEVALTPQDVVVLGDKGRTIIVSVSGPRDAITAKRREELLACFSGRTAELAFVSAFRDRQQLQNCLPAIAWDTSVWLVQEPNHVVHFGRVPFFRLKRRTM